MTKITAAQEALLSELRAAKTAYDDWERVAQAQFEGLRSEQKEPIRKLVSRAIEAGIPVRQIHLKGLDYKQVSSMTSFLSGGARLGVEHIKGLVNGMVPAPAAVAGITVPDRGGKPEFVQKPGQAHWTDPHTGEARVTDRLDGPVYFYYMNDATLETLTDEERAWFADDAKTLMGSAENDEYFTNGNEPERWDGQPDAKMRR